MSATAPSPSRSPRSATRTMCGHVRAARSSTTCRGHGPAATPPPGVSKSRHAVKPSSTDGPPVRRPTWLLRFYLTADDTDPTERKQREGGTVTAVEQRSAARKSLMTGLWTLVPSTFTSFIWSSLGLMVAGWAFAFILTSGALSALVSWILISSTQQ